MNLDWGPEVRGLKILEGDDVLRTLFNSDGTIAVGRVMAFDVETDEKDNFVCASLYGGGSNIYYFESVSALSYVLPSFYFVGHSLSSDFHFMRKNGVDLGLSQYYADTNTMAYTVDSAGDHHLKYLVKEKLGLHYPEYRELVGKGKKKITMDKQEKEIRRAYNCMDSYVTWQLWRYFLKTMTFQEALYYRSLEFPITLLLYEMEKKGVKIDVKYIRSLEKTLTTKVEELKKELWKAVGEEFNPNSWQQKVKALNKIGIKVKKTDKKKDLFPYRNHWFVKLLSEYSEVEKLRSTYTKSLYNALDKDDRLHPEFTQSTITGRLASKKPNLQNIPVQTPLGREIRKAFVSKEGCVLLEIDYSQIDLRALAHFSQEPVWMTAFYYKNADPHKALADKTGISRQEAKTLNFTLVYGSGPKNVAYEMKCSNEEAKDFMEKFRKGVRKYEAWRGQVHYLASKMGYVQTLLGRRVRLKDINSPDRLKRGHAERQAVNVLGQGSPAEIIKLAMLKIRRDVGLVPLIQVHDSLLYEVYEKDVHKYEKQISEIMTNVVRLSVPLEVKTGVGKNWAKCKA